MTAKEVTAYRLYKQQIANHTFQQPGEVISWLGAIQAQDYAGAKWSVGLRLPGSSDTDIEQAIAAGLIVRTWLLRGTLHLVASADLRWMLKLLAPRIIAGSAGRQRQLELNEKIFTHAKKILIRTLQGGKQLTRNELYALLEHCGISTAGQRGTHILWRTAQEGVICFASHRSKQPTFALLEEWLPSGTSLSFDESLSELALRYFTSHGPASLYDFAWWSGLKISDAKAGLEMASAQLTQTTLNNIIYWMSPEETPSLNTMPKVFLLPGFDEYMLGYKDRSMIIDPLHIQKIVPGNNGMFMPTIVINGRIAGTWKRIIRKNTIAGELFPFNSLSKTNKLAADKAFRLYSLFLGVDL